MQGLFKSAMIGFILRYLHIWVPLLILVAGIALRLYDPAAIQQLRLMVFDEFQRLEPREYKPAPVRIADLDDGTLEKLGQWPWSRDKVAEMVARLSNMGAAAVVFDIVFAETDRTSPTNVLPTWRQADIDALKTLWEQRDKLPDPDKRLAEVLAHPASTVITGFFANYKNLNMPAKKAGGFGHKQGNPHLFLPIYTGATPNIDIIGNASTGNGSFNMIPYPDGMVRRVPSFIGVYDSNAEGENRTDKITLLPSLAMESLRVIQGAKSFITFMAGSGGSGSRQTGLEAVQAGFYNVPTDAEGQIWLHQTEFLPERYVPIWKIFDGSADPSLIEGHIVLIGTSAGGLVDLRTTPLNPALPGVEVHAQILEQIFHGDFLERPDWAAGAEVVYMLALGLILVLLLPRVGAILSFVIALAAILAALGVSWYIYSSQQTLLDPIYPTLIVILIYITTTLIVFFRTEAEKQKVRGAFSMYLSPDLVEQLAESPDSLVLGGEMKNMTVLFMDIRGFTSISEQFDAQGLTNFINSFLTPMTAVILDQRGTIDKYMGDCIMAFWNAPLDDPDHAANACRAALKMVRTRDSLNEIYKFEAERDGRKYIPLNVGIGVNTGNICVGNMGSEQRFDYSVLGDDVNLGSRLEGQSKTYGVNIVIGENTLVQVPGMACLELDLIKVKGKLVPVRIFTLLGDEALADTEGFQKLAVAHKAMIEAYRSQHWEQCEKLIAMCRTLAKEHHLDGLYDLYTNRVADYKATPPGADWDGVYTATSK